MPTQRLLTAIPVYCLLALALSAPLLAEEVEGELLEALRAQRQELRLVDVQLQGDAAAPLLAAARNAQFVLIGEDHGFADVPQFASALVRSLAGDAPANLVVEVGPYSTAMVEQALREGRDALSALNSEHPWAMPFLNFRQDGDLAALFVDKASDAERLWGIDQEFILSPQLHFEHLSRTAQTRSQREISHALVNRMAELSAKMIENKDPSSMPLLALTESDFEQLRAAFATDARPQERALVDALAHSAEIYRLQNSDPYRSNWLRSQLMKRGFMQRYRAAGGGAPARALFKMGAYHASRGLTPTRVYDIGNLASELAESNGSRSLHILVIAGGGTVNRWLPFTDPSARAQSYAAAEELGDLGLSPLLKAAADQGWSVFDLEALRQRRLPGNPSEKLRTLLYSYDRVVVIAQAQAATNDGL